MKIFECTITNEVGLHARPASVFVQTASKFNSEIRIRKVNGTKPAVNAKSILQVLTMGVMNGDRSELTVEGGDEELAAETLKTLLESNFAGKL